MKLSVETNHVFIDLQALQAFDINAYGRAAALLQELHDNQGTTAGQDLIDQLNIQGRELNPGAKMIGDCLRIENEKLKRDLWRLKLWRVDANSKQHLEPYRIIYGFYAASQFRRTPEIRIFAVPCRAQTKEDSYDYKLDDPIAIRFRSDYDAYL